MEDVKSDLPILEIAKDTTWAFYLDMRTFETIPIQDKDMISVGSVIMKGNQTIVTHSEYGTALHEHPDARYYIVENEELVQHTAESVTQYIKPYLVKYMVEQNVLPTNTKLKEKSKNVKIRVAAIAERFYLDFDIRLSEDDVPGNPADFALGLKKTENYTSWSIETDPAGRARCRACRMKITKGSLRFIREGMYYGDSSRDKVKRHPKCMSAQNFGYIDPRTIHRFNELDDSVRDKILQSLMGWRLPLVVSSSTFSSYSPLQRFAAQNGVLARMDIGVGMVETDILDELRSVFQESDFGKFREDVSALARAALKVQLDRGGLTLYLDTEKMKPWPEFASLIPSIIDLRKDEMDKCIITKVDETYDLRALWLTHWGFKLLRTTHKWLTASGKTMPKVQKLMSAAGFKLNVQETNETPIHVKMSPQMRDFIWSHGQGNVNTLAKFQLKYP